MEEQEVLGAETLLVVFVRMEEQDEVGESRFTRSGYKVFEEGRFLSFKLILLSFMY